MYLDSDLKIAVISSLFWTKSTTSWPQETVDVMSVEDLFLKTMIRKRLAYVKDFFLSEEHFFPPKYDYDFTDLTDSAGVQERGWALWSLKGGTALPYRSDVKIQMGTPGWAPTIGGVTRHLENGLGLIMEQVWLQPNESSQVTTVQDADKRMEEGSTWHQIQALLRRRTMLRPSRRG